MLEIINGGSLALMTAIGHQTGLFDTMASLPPSTSKAIAERANLNERYVREWLGAMVAGGIVEYTPETQAYLLPREHAQSLTRAAGPGNLASVSQFIPMLAKTQDGVVECFRNGGGVPYSEFHTFQRLMAEDSAAVHDGMLVPAILPIVDGMPQRLADGIDVA